MAELLGIVAGGAGLASLALQLVDGGQKLRQRYKNVKSLGVNISWLSEDIELIGKQLIQLETSADDIMQEQLGPIMMERCRDRSARQHLFLRNSRNSLVTVDSASSMTSIISLPTEIAPHDNSPGTTTTYQHGIIQCSSCSCRCSCHKKRTISGTFWRLQYSPLAEIFQACDNPACSVRRYRFDLRLALYRYGIPLKATLGFDLTTEPGRYSLQPCLQIETVVDFNALGFVIMEQLALEEIGWATAENMFKDLYKSCPGFVNQIDPLGRGYLEDAARDFSLYTHCNDESSKTITNLIQLFVSSFRTKETSHSAGLVSPPHCYPGTRPLTCSSLLRQLLYLMELGHVGSVGSLAALGCDFKNVVPTLSSWPAPFHYQDDPFHFQRLKTLIGMSTDFGDSPPLHASILFDSNESFMLCLDRNTQPFDTTVNLLGQSALHMAVQQPSRVAQLLAAGHHVDQSDKYGGTPLLYAAAMDIPDTVMMLVENGANLLSSLSNCDPIICIVARQQNWTLVWRIIDFAAASHPYLVPQLIKDLLVWTPEEVYHAAHHSKGQDGCEDFWSRVISKLGSPNFSFQDGKTLMHMTRGVRSARALIKSGFNKFKQRKGDLLEHIASLHDPPLFRFAVANGGDAHLHSSWGWHILDMLLRDLARSDWDNLPKVLEILQGLLDNGVQVSSRDEWVCNCLTGGHSDLVSDVDNNRFWDISEQISIDELKQKMEDLATKTYSELKIEVMVRLRGRWRKACAAQRPPKLARSRIQVFLRGMANDLKELLKTSKHPKIPEPFSSSWDRIVQKKMESNRWRLDYDLELAVVEFGFESWVPLLTQLTDVLLAEEESGALES
ncbi:uncharacterized protein FOBCDRAFT_240361 [Fusarium oxysporum Fo47]|uniref:uncharacterized protein n=1 Tax=Fusarium oxysporum Fo47 TaxID=660027 RepID=UPI002869CBE7|nr:uncharacterized protein FOBCDRAFT_240361 [Fusarium oxysporum Fo47]WJG35385.1 hypothetical protein FOBCDRAFT_240361 [Fusarium oxysporum Fo47]